MPGAGLAGGLAAAWAPGSSAFFAVAAVMAVMFRNQRARESLKFIRNVAWVYIAVIVGLAVWRLATG